MQKTLRFIGKSLVFAVLWRMLFLLTASPLAVILALICYPFGASQSVMGAAGSIGVLISIFLNLWLASRITRKIYAKYCPDPVMGAAVK